MDVVSILLPEESVKDTFLARACGVSPSTIGRWRKTRNIPLPMVERLAGIRGYEISVKRKGV